MDYAAKLLIIDDDPAWVGSLKLYLSKQRYDCVVASNGRDGLHLLYSERPEMVLLDLMMPDMDGWEVCDRIREMSNVPIIILSALSQETTKCDALGLGADDYMTKPVALRELIARIEAVLRRNRLAGQEATTSVIGDEDLRIDTEHWEVRLKGEPIELTPTEMRFLIYLASNANQVLTHRQILNHVWGHEYTDDLNYTKLFAWRIRSKIEDDPAEPRYIITERGIGYRFRL